jgi:simple sugar transport system permease protein
MRVTRQAGSSLAAVVLALVVGALLVAIAGGDPLVAYRALIDGGLGSPFAIGQVLVVTTPLLIIGLGLAVAFRAGVWNIGAEGQLFMGALAGGATAVLLPLHAGVPLILVACAAGMAAGAAWGGVVGGLRARWGVNEVISSLLLNYVAVYAFTYVIRQPLRDPAASSLQGETVPAIARLPVLDKFYVHIGIFVALALVPVVGYLLSRAPFGFRLQMMGMNPDAAEAAGVSRARTVVTVMLISGGLAGLAGVFQILGVAGRLDPNISQSYGFTAIVVALLGRLRATGVLLAALFIAFLNVGGQAMSVAESLPYAIILAIQGVFVIFLLIADRLARG